MLLKNLLMQYPRKTLMIVNKNVDVVTCAPDICIPHILFTIGKKNSVMMNPTIVFTIASIKENSLV